jgi:hypothetical protein
MSAGGTLARRRGFSARCTERCAVSVQFEAREWDSLVVQVEQELVVQPLDILVRAHTLLQILILASSVNRVIHHDSVHVVVLVGLEDGLFDANTNVGLVAERAACGADLSEFVFDAEGFAGFACELGRGDVVLAHRTGR